MQKLTTCIDIPRHNRESLGLRTPPSFELQLLEIAMGGKETLEKHWKEETERFDISENVMCLEILREFEQLEKGGNTEMLVERARNQVVKMKGCKYLHHRALLAYRYYLNLSISRQSLDYSSLRTRRGESVDRGIPRESRERESKEYSRSTQVLTIDERLDVMLGIELPEMLEEESSNWVESGMKTQQSEQSGSSCEVLSIVQDSCCERQSIFKVPRETEGFISPGSPLSSGVLQENSLSEMWSNAEKSGERCSILKVQNSPNLPIQPQKCLTRDDVDLKIDFEGEKTPKVRGSFPGKDLKNPIEWKVDNIVYLAMSLSDLRKSHDIVMEGTFRKRGARCHRWRKYYGFFLDTGIMLYFRGGVFKRVADFRKSTPFIPKSKQFILNIRGLYVNSKASDWLLKFENEKKLDTWYETILKLCEPQKNNGLGQLLGPPKKVHEI